MNFPRLQLTNAGMDAVLDAVYNGPNTDTLTFTCVKIGSGTYNGDPKTRTNLVTVQKTLGFSSITVADGIAKLTFILDNINISTGFYMRELGLFAKFGSGAEFLYAYSNAGNNAAYVKPYQSDSNISFVVTANVAVGDASSVTAIISGAVGYVTQSDFEDHLTDYNNPHRVTKAQVGLGNVPNLAPNNMTVTFTEASTLSALTSGSTLSALFGKLAKAVSRLIQHLADGNNPHGVTKEQLGIGEIDTTPLSDQTVTFTKGNTLTTPTSGSAVKTIIGHLAYAVDTLRNHINARNNPHQVTYSQVNAAAANHSHTLQSLGAASSSHTHNAADITSGILPVARGGTGVTSYTALAAAMAATVAETKTYLGIS